MEVKPEEYLQANGFSMSTRKPHLWYRENGEKMEYIDLEKMSCYAYVQGKPTDADPKTEIALRSLRSLMDKEQSRLF